MFRSGSSGLLRPRSLRCYLAVLVLAALLPMAGAAAFALWRLVQAYRAAALLPLQATLLALAPPLLAVALLALGAAGVLWVARRVLHPVQALAHKAEALRASETHYRQLSQALAQEKDRLAQALVEGTSRLASLQESLQVPVVEAHARQAEDKGLQPALAALAGLRVLVVDDNALNREVASEFLQAVRMQVVLAANGLEALDCLRQADFDMVLMDLQMPVMDGLSASREIRQHARWSRLPLIALTAHDAQMGHPATVAVGMDAYLGKPIDAAMLYQTLLQFAPRPARARPLPLSGAALPGLADAGLPAAWPGLDLPLALSRLGGRPASLQRALQGFVRDFADLPAQWQPARPLPPRPALARQAHTLKSSAPYLGADALAAAARQLEALAAAAPPEVLATAMAGVCQQLAPVLASVASLLAQRRQAAEAADASDGTVNVAALLACLAQARPLVAQGNYAALGLLERIRDTLAPTALARLADTAWTQFEDLNLPAASRALAALHNALEDPQKDAP